MNLDVGLNKFRSRLQNYINSEQNEAIGDFLKIVEEIKLFASNSPLSTQAFSDFNREFPEPKRSSPPWGFYYGTEILPSLQNSKEKFYFPLMHPFTKVNATVIEDTSKDFVDLIINFSLRAILSLPIGDSVLYMMDSNISGDFNRLSSISTEPDDLDSEKNYFHYVTIASQKEYVLNELEEIVDSNIRNYVSEYTNLIDYNKNNPSMHVPYRFLFIKDIKGVLNDSQIQRLSQLVQSGNATKAGVYIFFSYNAKDLGRSGIGHSTNILKDLIDLSTEFYQPNKKFKSSVIEIENKADAAVVDKTIDFVRNQKAPSVIMSMRESILKKLASDDIWDTNFPGKPRHLYIPVGFETATELKEVDFNFNNASPHIFVGGKTGSGKSVLLHNLILNGALRYSPDQLRYYLVDMKKGVSFPFYKGLPHVIALSASDVRHYALSVLARMNDEILKRGNLFIKAKCTHIDDYNRIALKNGESTIPYICGIIDEFQELFIENDEISNRADKLIKSIHRLGRSQGVFLALSTQSLGAVQTDISQVGIKFSLVANRNDSVKLIGNDAAATLKGMGRAILNTSESGEKHYNQEFQVAFIDEAKELPQYVKRITEIYKLKYGAGKLPRQLYYDDNHLTSSVHENENLIKAYSKSNLIIDTGNGLDIYIGIPAFCRSEHVKYRLHRNSMNHIVITGTDRTSAMRITGSSVIQFLAGFKDSKVFIIDLQQKNEKTYNALSFLTYNSEDRVIHITNEVVQSDGVKKDFVLETIKHIHGLLKEREENIHVAHLEPEILLSFVDFKMMGIFRVRRDPFAANNDLTPLEMLNELIERGPDVGIHVLLYGYNTNNIENVLPEVYRSFEVKIALRGQNALKALYGFGRGEIVDKNGLGFILMPEDMGLTHTDGDKPGDPFVVYNTAGSKELEKSLWGTLFSRLPDTEI